MQPISVMSGMISIFEYNIFTGYRQKDNKNDGWFTESVRSIPEFKKYQIVNRGETKFREIILSAIIMFSLSLNSLQAQTIKYIEGNVYKTVKIGTQTSTAENLMTTEFRNVKALSLVNCDDAWSSGSIAAISKPAYYWYGNDAKNKCVRFSGTSKKLKTDLYEETICADSFVCVCRGNFPCGTKKRNYRYGYLSRTGGGAHSGCYCSG